MEKIVLLTLVALGILASTSYALPPYGDWGFGFPGMGMMGPWGHMNQAFHQHLVASLEEKCGEWQRDEFEGLNLSDDEQTRVRDLCQELSGGKQISYTAPFELISLMSRRKPEEVPYAELYQ